MDNTQALEFYKSATASMSSTSTKNAKSTVAAEEFCQIYHLPETDMKKIASRFTYLITSRPNNKSASEVQEEWNSRTFHENIPLVASQKRASVGRPSLTLGDDPCAKTARNILKEQVECIELFAKEQNISNSDALDKLVAECRRKWKTSEVKKMNAVPVESATAIMYCLNLSTNQYQLLRTMCLTHDIDFPKRNDIDDYKKSLHPPIKSLELKAAVEMDILLHETSSALVKLNAKHVVQEGTSYKVIGKFGVDGSGAHKLRHQKIASELMTSESEHIDPTRAASFLLQAYCPLKIICGLDVVWSNIVPNSTTFCRPVSLTRATETRDVLKVELEPVFKFIRAPFEEELIIDGKVVKMHYETECSMVDGKMVDLLAGDSGAFCHFCTSTKANANDIDLIKEGFNIDKDFESCRQAWEKLQSGSISYSSSERQGQCHENLIKADLHCFSVLHMKLRSLDFIQKIYYHLVAGRKDWKETGNYLLKC